MRVTAACPERRQGQGSHSDVIRIGDNVNGRTGSDRTWCVVAGRRASAGSSGLETRESGPTVDRHRLRMPKRGRRRTGRQAPSRPPGGPAFVIGHGFTHGLHKPATRSVMAAFATHGAVVAVDFRGHGRSGGRSSVGRDEIHDLDAAVTWTRSRGYGPITVVGFSMGAAIALRHAALGSSTGDAVVAVSAPARWYMRDSAPMRKVHWLLETPLGPTVGRVLGVRLGEPWLDLPASPVEAVARHLGPTAADPRRGRSLLQPVAGPRAAPGGHHRRPVDRNRHGPRRDRDNSCARRSDRRLVDGRDRGSLADPPDHTEMCASSSSP